MDPFRILGLVVWNLFAVFGFLIFIASVCKLAARASRAPE